MIRPLMLVSLCLCLVGCGEGMSTEDAEEECSTIQANHPNSEQCMTAAAFSRCVACYEECGDSCGVVDTVCDFTFNCPTE